MFLLAVAQWLLFPDAYLFDLLLWSVVAPPTHPLSQAAVTGVQSREPQFRETAGLNLYTFRHAGADVVIG